MKTANDLYNYQQTAVQHILDLNGAMLWLDVGTGKTIISLTAIEYLLDSYRARGALVVAPKKVIEAVWEQEALGWQHTRRLKFSRVTGTPKQRLQALFTPADVYLTNYEQIPWLQKTLQKGWIDQETHLPFDIVIFDEVSKMKSATTKRGRAFAKLLPYFIHRVGLTGTPATNGVIDLHGQYLMIDGGLRLGPNVTTFRDRWFIQNPYSYKYQPRNGATKEIQKRVADITIEMSAKDHLELPPLVNIDKKLTLSKDIMLQYKEFEKEFFLELGDSELEAFNAAAKSAKCRQLANGAVYTNLPEEARKWELLHDEKLDALEELVESLNGEPLLLCYQFIHDKERIKARFPEAVVIDSGNVAPIVDRWNKREIQLLVGHPASMGHGLNLQYGGHHICWFGVPWDLEHYLQAIGRLLRNGQKQTVFNHRLLAEGTIEPSIAEAIAIKDTTQSDLRSAVKRYKDTIQIV